MDTSHDQPLDRIEGLLLDVCQNTPESQWEGAVDQLCLAHPADTAAIRRRFSMLRGVGPLEPQPLAIMPAAIAGYRLLRRIGAGGMGVVYLAMQESTGREVVLKLIRSEFLGSQRARERFRREVAAASSLDHPGICTIYEAGEVDGAPFLVMRHVPGETLSARIERQRMAVAEERGNHERTPVNEAILLVESLARALHTAHEAGLVHRDVKPANVMVQPDGQPVLLDFGLARAMEGEAHLTVTGEVIGTPAYMSPEQIGSTQAVDRRSDVYALGVTLYELLTGRLPFGAPTRDLLYRQILDGQPERASHWHRAVSRDLDVVVATAMERDRDRRYATARDLAEDLRRVRCLQPIAAKPAGWGLRLRRWSQRNPVPAALTTTLAVALALSIWLTVRGDRALAASRTHQLVLESGRVGNTDTKLALYLASKAHESGDPTDGKLQEVTVSRLAEAIAADKERARIKELPFNNAWRVCFAPDGETVWFGGLDANGEPVRRLARWHQDQGVMAVDPGGFVSDFDVRPGSGEVAVACREAGTMLVEPDGTTPQAIASAPAEAVKLRFLDRDHLLVGTRTGIVEVVDLAAGNSIRLATWQAPVGAIATSPRRSHAAVGSEAGQVIVVTCNTLEVCPSTLEVRPSARDLRVDRLWVAEDGQTAVRTHDWRLRVLDAAGAWVQLPQPDRTMPTVIGSCTDPINMCQLSPEGLITGHIDQLVRIRDLGGPRMETLTGHAGWVFEIDVSADGTRMATGAGDGGIAVWDLPGRRLLHQFRDVSQPSLVRFFPSGDRLLVASQLGPVRILQLQDPWLPELTEHRSAVRFCRSWPASAKAAFLTADASGNLVSWSGEARPDRRSSESTGQIGDLACSADGSFCAIFCRMDKSLRVLDRELNRMAPPETWSDCTGDAMTVGAGKDCILAVSKFDKSPPKREWRLRRWRGQGALEEVPVPAGLPPAKDSWAIQFSPVRDEVLIGGRDGCARLYQWSEGAATEVAVLPHGDGLLYIQALAFSPDGNMILTGAADGTMRMWHRDGTAVDARFVGHKRSISHVAFQRDGDGVVSLTEDQLRVWSMGGRCIMTITPGSGSFADFALLPDGKRVAIGSTATKVLVRLLRTEDIVATARAQLLHYEPGDALAPFEKLLQQR